MTEIWKPIVGYEGYYEVSNLGNVRSLDRYINAKRNARSLKKGCEMKLQESHKGYLTVILHKNCKGSTYQVHRLVASAFIPNPENKEQVNHIDCNKKNNNVENLEWCTNRENMQHAVEHGLFQGHRELRLRQVKKAKAFNILARQIAVDCYELDGTFVGSFESIKQAGEKTNSSPSKIRLVCKGTRNKTNNLVFRFKGECYEP